MKPLSVIIYPEIAAQALKNEEADLYIIWLVLRAMDVAGQATGIISVQDVQDACEAILGVTPKWAYSKIKDGVDKYWRSPVGKRGERTMGLLGQKKVIARLQPKMTRCEPFIVPLSELTADGSLNLKRVKQYLIAIIASRFVDNRPITVETVMEYTGLSESTIRNALRDCPRVNKRVNYEVVHQTGSRSEAYQMQKKLYRGTRCCRVVPHEDGYAVIKQVGNTYTLPEPDRLPLRARPRELKDFDKENNALYGGRKYHARKARAGSDGLFFISFAPVGRSKAGVWKSAQVDDDTPLSPGGKWSRQARILSATLTPEAM